ncbi:MULTISPECIES: PilZ domain-containing protein [unclassified Novosphingobium]|uniref:PilZ domain-containing protein n=1 Tax=Novosphingobium TaxID=165696 RepID=UPI000B0001EC|nr:MULTISPECIES: PilZ domain-containing protein [unclassified Novosphingobium]TCM39289.1 hypothetical protein EDF59_106170 [Novosphingobium sp. ST904]WRT92845.1 PilZ domain-containing protein [Novosphingobium sp. RL4]
MNRPFLQRRAERQPISLAAQCRANNGLHDGGLHDGGGLHDEGEISDLSTEGCCVRIAAPFLCVGSRVVIRPQGLAGMTGIVRWLSGDFAGIEFDRPLFGSVIEHLVRLHPTFVPERRAIG